MHTQYSLSAMPIGCQTRNRVQLYNRHFQTFIWLGYHIAGKATGC
ncbi:MAG: hypothetical protein KatS3mg072_2674 [Meiothermus sp.]|nr:MAG: hypothetical protein KatS3mg072_2674 [Meiothermus sp.]